MKIHRMPQRSHEWEDERLKCCFTASDASYIVTPNGKASTQSRKLLYLKVAQRLLNRPLRWRATTEAMEHGTRYEDDARFDFERRNGIEVDQVGLITTDDGRLGCSPDGLIDNGHTGLEIKAPQPWTQIGYLLDGCDDYYGQMQAQMLIAELDAVTFYSYHPELSPVQKRYPRDEPYIRFLNGLLQRFCDDVEAEHERALRLGDDWWRNFRGTDEDCD